MAEFKVCFPSGVLSVTLPDIAEFYLLNVCGLHQVALSPAIYDTLTRLMTSLISMEMEKTVLKCSFSRVRTHA